jgi:small-conductance mechanosensitive channel
VQSDVLGVVESLGGLVDAVLLEVLLSGLVVLAVVGIRYGARKWHARSDGGEWRQLAVSGAAALATGGGVVMFLGVWDLLEPLERTYRNLVIEDLAGKLLLSGVILASAYTLTSFVGRAIGTLTGTTGHISEHEREILFRLTQVAMYTVAVLAAVGLFTQNLGGLLVGAGFLGIVVGMAARQTLGAVLAGFVLMFSRPFEIGDWVQVGEQEGIITRISIVNTRIQTFDGEYVMLPNDEVSSKPITNRTRKGRLRVEVEVGVDYEADPSHAADVALSAVKRLDEVLTVPTPQVVGKRFADSSVVLGVRFWIDNPSARRKWRAQTAVIDAVKRAFAAEGIKIPFPQRELTGRVEEGGFRLADDQVVAAESRGEAPEPTPDGGDDER